MAEKKQELEVWSWNENFPGTDFEKDYGLTKEMLEKIFGDNDIKVRVPDKNSFLNPKEAETNVEKFESEKLIMQDLINSIRKQNGLTEKPRQAYSPEELEELRLKAKYRAELDREHDLIKDPQKVKVAEWKQKFEDDKRGWTTFMTGAGREEGFKGPDEGIYGTVKGIWQEGMDWEKFGKYWQDSFMGLQATGVRLLPDNNKQNWSITGEFLGNLPFYFLSKKKAAQKFMNPKVYGMGYPADVAKIAGSASVGAYTAATAYDAVNHIIRQLDGLPDPELSTDPRVENLLHARNALVFTGGAAGLDPLFQKIKGVTRWAYGVNNGTNAQALAKAAIKQEVPFGIAHVTDRSWAKWYGKVVGVFPFVGTPLRAQKAQIAWYLDKRLMDTFNELAPLSSVQEVGLLLQDAAHHKFTKYARMNAQFYDDFFKKATALDNMVGRQGFVPTTRIKNLSKEWKEMAEAQKLPTHAYEEGLPREIGGIPAAAEFEKFLMSLATIDDYITANQFRGLQREFNKSWREYAQKYGAEAGDSIVSESNKFKRALEEGLNDTQMWRLPKGQDGLPIPGSAELMEQTIHSLKRANKYFGDFANTYDVPIAKRFTLVDENVFAAGTIEKPGWMKADQLAEDIFDNFFTNKPSAESLKDLGKMITRNYKNPNKDPLNMAAREYMQKVFNRSAESVAYNPANGQFRINVGKVDPVLGVPYNVMMLSPEKGIVHVNVFNPAHFSKLLKLGTKDGEDFLTELWRQTHRAEGKNFTAKQAKESINNMDQLLKLAQRGYETKIAETAQFVARRATLAGVSGITGAFLATSAGVSPLTGVGMALLARHQSKILTNPDTLEWLVKTIDDELPDKIRRSNYTRLARVLFRDEPNIPEGLDIKDPNEVMNYLMGQDFSIANSQSMLPPGERSATGVKKTFEPVKGPIFPFAKEEIYEMPTKNTTGKGPIESMGQEEYIRQNMENKQSNNVSAEVKSRMASNYVRRPGGPIRGKLNPNQRGALAGGNLYSAIAAAKHGGAVYNDGIMNLANRRRA